MMYVMQARSSSCYASLCNVLLNVLSFFFWRSLPYLVATARVFMAVTAASPPRFRGLYGFSLWTALLSALVLLLKTLFILSTWTFSRFSNCLPLTATPPPQSSIPPLLLPFPALPLEFFQLT